MNDNNKLINAANRIMSELNESEDIKEIKKRIKYKEKTGKPLTPKEKRIADKEFLNQTVGDNSHLSQAKSIIANAKKDKKYGEPIKKKSSLISREKPHAPVGGEMTQTGITEEEELQRQTLVNGVESVRMKYIKSIADSIKTYSELLPKAQSQYGMNNLAVQIEHHLGEMQKEMENSMELLDKSSKEEIEEYQKTLNEEKTLPPELEKNTKDDKDDEDEVPEVLEDGSPDEDHNEPSDDSIDQIPGGEADHLSVEEIAKKHFVSPEVIRAQLEKGTEVEMEHTDDGQKAREIALDHLVELPDYYDRLDEMEKEGKQELKEKIKDKEVDLSDELTKDEKKELGKEPSISEKNETHPDKDNSYGTINDFKKYTDDQVVDKT